MLMAGWVGRGEGELAQEGRTELLTISFLMVFSSILNVEAVSLPVPEPGAEGPHSSRLGHPFHF